MSERSHVAATLAKGSRQADPFDPFDRDALDNSAQGLLSPTFHLAVNVENYYVHFWRGGVPCDPAWGVRDA
jgi:hypothetical protein